jgi:putative tricarboxylic transport membrane protein
MRAPQALIGAGTLAIAALMASGATQISAEAGYGGVGPNFVPWVVAVMLASAAPGSSGSPFSGGFRTREEPSGASAATGPGFAWVSAGMLLNAALITRIGFILSCTLCFVFAVRGYKASQGRARPPTGGVPQGRACRPGHRRAGVLDVHQAAGDQPARPDGNRLDLRTTSGLGSSLRGGRLER